MIRAVAWRFLLEHCASAEIIKVDCGEEVAIRELAARISSALSRAAISSLKD
jgi:hypothetical protein